jgi:3beta-hydroxy-delta5-steroid dehydrogenase/steroid delta-isomerase
LPDLGRCLVTGGAGYLGSHLARELLRQGHRVHVLDRREANFAHENLECATGDVTRFDDVRRACAGVDTVFHTAACFRFERFATRAQRAEAFAVNQGGVVNVVRAATEAGVSRLVHTSSNNVTFDSPVVEGDESWPYATRVRDLYTQTKILGERAALEANGRDGLLTCAIRPGGIYGQGEEVMLARLVETCVRGLYRVTLGDGSALSDIVYIDNLVDAEIAAARHLEPGSPVCGRAYFVSDGHPINYFEFFRPLVEALGCRQPRWKIPARLALGAAWTGELLHRALRAPRPLVTHLEVRKTVVSHYNRIGRAKRDFGWEPRVSVAEAREQAIAYCRELAAEMRSRRS